VRYTLILFPVTCLLLCGLLGNVEDIGSVSYNYTYNSTTQNILTLHNETLQTFFPAMIGILLGSAITLGLVFFGSGIRGISIYIAIVFTFFLAVWSILSVFAVAIFSIPLIGDLIYIILTIMYFLGVAGFISPMAGGD